MSGPAYVSDPQVQYLTQLLDEIAKGYLQIPTFQRRFVWTDEKRLELLQSIREGIPIGSILVWRTGLKLPEKTPRGVRTLGPHTLPPPPESQATPRTYLLDGMQRLSTLYGCLRPLPQGVSPFIEDEDGERQSWLVCFDLQNETFEIAKTTPFPETWLPLTSLLDSVRLIQLQRWLAGLPNAELLIRRADALAETFRNYKLPIIPVVSDNLADATRTFQRVNSQGTRMSELHMVRALTWSESFDLEERIDWVRSRLTEVGWEALDPDLIMKTLKAALGLDISGERPDELSRSLTDRTFIEVTESLYRTAQWLSNGGFRSPRLVPYSEQIVLLSEAFRINPTPQSPIIERLWRWLWLTTYSGYFTGLSGYRLQGLLEGVRRLARGERMDWPGKQEPVPNFELPKHFRAQSARVKATAWLLANHWSSGTSSPAINVFEQLAGRGPAAMVAIVPLQSGLLDVKGIANRTFAGAGHDIRPMLLGKMESLSQDLLWNHVIDPNAARALTEHDFVRFLQIRKANIEWLARQFFENLPNV